MSFLIDVVSKHKLTAAWLLSVFFIIFSENIWSRPNGSVLLVPQDIFSDSSAGNDLENIVDDFNCVRGGNFIPPFLVSDVYRKGTTETFEKQNGVKVSMQVDSENLISQIVTSESGVQVQLPRGSLVSPEIGVGIYSGSAAKKPGTKNQSVLDFDQIRLDLFNNVAIAQSIFSNHQRFQEKINQKTISLKLVTDNEIYSRMQSTKSSIRSAQLGERILKVPISALISVDGGTRLVAQKDFVFNIPELPGLNQPLKTIKVTRDSYFQFTPSKIKEYPSYSCYEMSNQTFQLKSYYEVTLFDSAKHFEPKTFFINTNESNFEGNLLPMLADQVQAVSSVQEKIKRFFKGSENIQEMLRSFRDVNYMNFIRLPTVENQDTGEDESLDDINSYIHYGTEVDPLASDDWGRPSTICGIMELSFKWKRHCDQAFGKRGCTLQIGDIAFPVGGVAQSKGGMSPWKKVRKGRRNFLSSLSSQPGASISHKGRDILGHLSHFSGSCVDIRPLRNDNAFAPAHIGIKNYDRNRTIEFVRMAKEFGATKIFFNDPVLIRLGLTRPQPGHDDHVHICFESRDFCEN